MRIYLCGPMTGEPLWGFQAFENAAVALRNSTGQTIVSPHEQDINDGTIKVTTRPHGGNYPLRIFETVELAEGFNRDTTLTKDFHIILDCDAIALLPRWEESDGACRELAVACLAKKQVFDVVGSTLVEWMPEEIEVIAERILDRVTC